MKAGLYPVIGVMLILGVISGCSTHQISQVEPEVTLPDTYAHQAQESGAGEHMPARWWESFQDPELNALMARAFARNADLRQAVARLDQALSLQKIQRADGLPTLNAKGAAARSRELSAAGANTGTTTGLSLSAAYEVDLWQKFSALNQASRLDAQASREDLLGFYLFLSSQVADTYYRMVSHRAKLNLIQETITAREVILAMVERRYREGTAAALDLYQARQNLAAARAGQPDVAAELAVTSHALAVLTGDYPTTKLGGNEKLLPTLPETFPSGLPSDLLKQRPDIRGAMDRLKAADHRIAAAVADRFPSINLLAELGRSGMDFGSSVSGTAWSLAGNLFMPILDFGKRKAEVEKNQARHRELVAAYQKTVLSAFQEVEDALVLNRKGRVSLTRIGVEVTASADALRLARSNYLDGLSDYLPVLTAQTSYFDSQMREISARTRIVQARISLASALGGNWMDVQNRPAESAPHPKG